VPLAGQHRPAVHEDARAVEAHHAHHDAGQRLVAAREPDQRVIGVPAHHQLDAVGDELAREQAHAHPAVAHRDAVRHRDRRELEWRATRRGDTELRRLGLGTERQRARGVLAVRAHDADEGLGHRRLVEAQGAHECPV